MTMLLIGGHPRSGTTLMTRLLNSHPDIAVSFEFRPFLGINESPRSHWKVLRKNFVRRRIVEAQLFFSWRSHSRSDPRRLFAATIDRLESYSFLSRYWSVVSRSTSVNLNAIRNAYQTHFERSTLVGDKWPEYVFILDDLIEQPALKLIMLSRDPRDVASSAIKLYANGWEGGTLGRRMSTAAGVAGTWSEATQNILNHREHIHLVHYEQLVTQPTKELASLGRVLGVDPDGFQTGFVRSNSIGKGRSQLPDEELALIERIARPEMDALGYLHDQSK